MRMRQPTLLDALVASCTAHNKRSLATPCRTCLLSVARYPTSRAGTLPYPMPRSAGSRPGRMCPIATEMYPTTVPFSMHAHVRFMPSLISL